MPGLISDSRMMATGPALGRGGVDSPAAYTGSKAAAIPSRMAADRIFIRVYNSRCFNCTVLFDAAGHEGVAAEPRGGFGGRKASLRLWPLPASVRLSHDL